MYRVVRLFRGLRSTREAKSKSPARGLLLALRRGEHRRRLRVRVHASQRARAQREHALRRRQAELHHHAGLRVGAARVLPIPARAAVPRAPAARRIYKC